MTKKIVILGAGKSSSYLVKYLYLKRIELDISISIVSNKYSNYLDEFESIDYQNCFQCELVFMLFFTFNPRFCMKV